MLIVGLAYLMNYSGLTYTLGRMTGSVAHGWAVWAAMAVLFLGGVTAAYWAEGQGNPLFKGVDQRASTTQSGGFQLSWSIISITIDFCPSILVSLNEFLDPRNDNNGHDCGNDVVDTWAKTHIGRMSSS